MQTINVQTKSGILKENLYDIKELSYLGKILGCKDSKKRGVSYYDIPCAFDIETSTVWLSPKRADYDVHSFMYIWQFQIEEYTVIGRTWEEFMDFLERRKNILEGVCISGGEPTIHRDLPEFIQTIKHLGFPVKLDTNGSNPSMLRHLIEEKLIDYVAMDVKNCPDRYAQTAGLPNLDISLIEQSMAFLLSDAVDYEFRTTAVEELHDDSSFEQIFLEQVLTLGEVESMDLEVYYNGDRAMTEFKIKCYKGDAGAWRYVGMYTPDFLIVKRRDGKIHKAIIVETKGAIYANDPTFKDKRSFMEREFTRQNNKAFGYERFEYLYLEDSFPEAERIRLTHEMICAFFKER